MILQKYMSIHEGANIEKGCWILEYYTLIGGGTQMILILDGYNILKKIVGKKHVSESERMQFINLLCEYADIKHHTIIVVFDGGMSLWPETDQYGAVRVVYVGTRQSADDYIIQMLQDKSSGDRMLISADRQLCIAAASLNIMSVDVDIFLDRVREAISVNKEKESKHTTSSFSIFDTNDTYLDELMVEGSKKVPLKDDGVTNRRIKQGNKRSKTENKHLKKLKKL